MALGDFLEMTAPQRLLPVAVAPFDERFRPHVVVE
jgi:hypothetical protein